MQKLIVSLFMILVLGQSCLAGVHFLDLSLEEATEQAASQDKLILIDLYTDWCVPCKQLDKHIFQDSAIGQFVNARFISLRKDAEADDGKAIMERYGILESYPTVLLLSAQGNEIDRLIGLYSKEDYFQDLKDFSIGKNTFDNLLQLLKAEPDNYEAMQKLGNKYAARGEISEALRYSRAATAAPAISTDAMHWFRIASFHFRISEYLQALSAIKKASQLNPNETFFGEFQKKIEAKLSQEDESNN